MIIHRTRLIKIGDKQYVDIRSYELAEARKQKVAIMVIVGDEAMEIKDFRKNKQIDKTEHQMKYPPFGSYKLYSFEWKNTVKVPKYIIS